MLAKNENGLEGVIYSLRALFSGYGYSQYKMKKFEEYDLYVKNKDFLISDSVITFTDTNGKLLALKPDVTLSIIKNTKTDEGIKKVFYNENVYRVSAKSNGYKEIAQIGLECIGEIDDYNVAEILTLAVQSLKIISDEFVLDVSPIGLLSAFIESLKLLPEVKYNVYKCINEKNAHELNRALSLAGVSENDAKKLYSLLEVYGGANEVIGKLNSIFVGTDFISAVKDFENTLSILPSEIKNRINVDCSSCENVKYYNEITFKGYIKGIPKEILSGGRYDGLVKRMGKNCKAIGFAIYPDEFDRIFAVNKEYDVDVVIQYSDNSDKSKILDKIQELYSNGKTATAVKEIPPRLTYKEKIQI